MLFLQPEDISHSLHSHTNLPHYRESRPRSQGGPIRRQDRKHDTSPYSSSGPAFLSPPPDTSWRRTNSDSALHQSATQVWYGTVCRIFFYYFYPAQGFLSQYNAPGFSMRTSLLNMYFSIILFNF